MKTMRLFAVAVMIIPSSLCWVPTSRSNHRRVNIPAVAMAGSLHGEDSCFLPLKQLDQDYYAPRIVQVRQIVSYVPTLLLQIS